MDRFWSVSSNGCINWKGNWEGITPGWRGRANHDYYVPIRDLAGPEERAYWVEDHIPEKAWCSPEAVHEFGRIVRRLFPDDARQYTAADVARQINAFISTK